MFYENLFQAGESRSSVNVSITRYLREDGVIIPQFPWHCHSFLEFQYFGKTRPGGTFTVGNRKCPAVERGIVFIPSLTPHAEEDIAFHDKTQLQFDLAFLQRSAPSFPSEMALVASGDLLRDGYVIAQKGTRLGNVMDELEKYSPVLTVPTLHEDHHIEYSPEYELQINAITLMMVLELIESDNLKISTETAAPTETNLFYQLLDEIIAHPEKQITLEEAADRTFMSYSSFSRKFKRAMGTNFKDFCNSARIYRAEELLVHTQYTSTRISEMLAFGSISYFNRVFKQFTGLTPSEFRQTYQVRDDGSKSD